MEQSILEISQDEESINVASVYLDKSENEPESAIIFTDLNRITICSYECTDYNLQNIKLIERKNFKYLGEITDNLRDGFGICYYTNGEIYKGQWKNDQRHGYGILVQQNGLIMQGQLKNDNFDGYCEHFNTLINYSIKGHFCCLRNKFIGYVIVHKENKTYEGEVITADPDNCSNNISIGTLIYEKTKKIFLGEIKNYKEECGYGIGIAKNSNVNNIYTMYQGLIRNKKFDNFLEMYNSDRTASFFFLENHKRNGIILTFGKDDKIAFGEYKNNHREGPFFHFSNCNNLVKLIRMEIFHLDFKCKVIMSIESSKEYLKTFYPEYVYILKYNYPELIKKFYEVINEENVFLNESIAKFYEDENKRI